MARATVWLRSGSVVEAEIGTRSGEAALDVLSILSDGTFTFFAEASARDGTAISADDISRNWESKQARVATLVSDLPSLIDALVWDTRVLEQLGQRHPERESLLAALRSGGTLLEALIDVDVELVSALELFVEATQLQKNAAGKPVRDARVSVGSSTLLQVTPPSATEPSSVAGAIVGVRPRRTVLGSDKRSLALSSQGAPSALQAPPEPAPKGASENLMGRTLVGIPVAPAVIGASTGAVNDVSVVNAATPPDAPADAKGRGRRFSQRTSAPAASGGLEALEVGDVLELVPETVRHPQPGFEPEKRTDSDTPPPSSVGGNSIFLGGRRLERVSPLSDIGRYSVQLVSNAGKGDGSEMALKMPRSLDPSAFAALTAEAAILGAVSHPNLVRLVQSGLDVDMPFLLTWYWPGVTLAELTTLDRALPEGFIVCVVRQVLDAASALHDPTNPRGGFVHCNLCPENVLIGFDGVVRVCGLSNARRIKSKDNDEDLSVHAQYAAPELLRGQRVDERTDVYSSGMLLGLALRGSSGQDSQQLSQLRAIWSRATDVVPAQRYPNARDVGMALDRIGSTWGPSEVADWLAKQMAQLKLEAARAAGPSHGAAPARRWRPAILLGVTLVVIVAVVLAWMLKR